MNTPTLYVTSFASIFALIVGANYAIGSVSSGGDMDTSMEAEEVAGVTTPSETSGSTEMPKASAETEMAVPAPQIGGQGVPAPISQDGTFMKFNVPVSGTYVLTAPTVFQERLKILLARAKRHPAINQRFFHDDLEKQARSAAKSDQPYRTAAE